MVTTDDSKALYALDPVGTCGLWRACRAILWEATSPTPPKYLGFQTNVLAKDVVQQARVVLMASETRKLYAPNVYATLPDKTDSEQNQGQAKHNCAQLCQV
jgi:hypothetical protein